MATRDALAWECARALRFVDREHRDEVQRLFVRVYGAGIRWGALAGAIGGTLAGALLGYGVAGGP